ncbi:MAG: hypothetical protein ACI3XZ_06120 [Butyricicoccus sp.]
MKQVMNGTSALADSACWNLSKLGSADEMAAYELRVQGTADEQASAVMMHVINGLLDGKHVGVIAESREGKTLSRLENIWRDGRMLKRGDASAFVALDKDFGELESTDIEPCTGASFRFMGFEGHAPEDTVFRSLMSGDSGAEIEVSCHNFEDGVLSIRFNAEKVDETETLGDISRAVSDCGRFLQIDM